MPRLIVPGNFQSQAIRFLPPDTDGLRYWGMYDGSAERAARNHAGGDVIASVTGAPVFGDDYADFTPASAFIQTTGSQSPDLTMIAVIRPHDDASGDRYVISNSASPAVNPPYATARGSQLMLSHGTAAGDGVLNLTMAVGVNNGGTDQNAGATIFNNVVAGQWSCVAGTYNSDAKQYRVMNFTSGATATITNANAANIGSGDYRVGSAINSNGANKLGIAMAAIYDVTKSLVQLTDIYADIKTYFAKRGIAI